MIFKIVSISGTIISRSAEYHEKSILQETAAASAQVSKFQELNCRASYVYKTDTWV
jgi:hypothetical protein